MVLPGPYCWCCHDVTERIHADGEGDLCDECRAFECPDHAQGDECPRIETERQEARNEPR